MFTELEKYKQHGHFYFEKGNNLKAASKDVSDKPGVYYVLKLSNRKVELVYIGKSCSMLQNGNFKDQLLRKRSNNKQGGRKRQIYFDSKVFYHQS